MNTNIIATVARTNMSMDTVTGIIMSTVMSIITSISTSTIMSIR